MDIRGTVVESHGFVDEKNDTQFRKIYVIIANELRKICIIPLTEICAHRWGMSCMYHDWNYMWKMRKMCIVPLWHGLNIGFLECVFKISMPFFRLFLPNNPTMCLAQILSGDDLQIMFLLYFHLSPKPTQCLSGCYCWANLGYTLKRSPVCCGATHSLPQLGTL